MSFGNFDWLLLLRKHCYQLLKELVLKLKSSPELPKVSCIISDAATTSFEGKVAKDLGIPEVQFFTASARGFMGYLQFDDLVKRGILPFKGPLHLPARNFLQGDHFKPL
ncbi:hypothetical protein L6164_033198 [Bauhinia variegata]|uniref:Uncharacterized protein n=1 Tax=Bauhinia variegata TaxID=167791 RepID=A0ACB9KR36_BAUVA|nr:hypothetical protein L6164_033198 [Bauhinia variegata]